MEAMFFVYGGSVKIVLCSMVVTHLELIVWVFSGLFEPHFLIFFYYFFYYKQLNISALCSVTDQWGIIKPVFYFKTVMLIFLFLNLKGMNEIGVDSRNGIDCSWRCGVNHTQPKFRRTQVWRRIQRCRRWTLLPWGWEHDWNNAENLHHTSLHTATPSCHWTSKCILLVTTVRWFPPTNKQANK